MKGLNKELMELYKNPENTYHKVAMIVNEKYGLELSGECVRKRIKYLEKKNVKTIQVENGVSKSLVFTDVHIPFHNEDVILDTIKKHRHEIDRIIWGGDILDCFQVSSFPKEYHLPFIEELTIAHKFFKRVIRLIKDHDIEMIMYWGNHEFRLSRYLAKNQSEINELLSSNPIEILVKGFTHYDRRTGKKKHYESLEEYITVIDNWYCQVDDFISAHPKNFSRVAVKTACSTADYFVANGFQFNTLSIGHTHKIGQATRLGKLVFEQGCNCKEMHYASSGNVNYTPQQNGYLLLVQKDGITDKNETRVIFY